MVTSTNERDALAARAVRSGVHELNAQLPLGGGLGTAPGSPIAGADGLDSLSTVVLLSAVESALTREENRQVPILDAVLERWDEAPLETVGSLSRFVASLLDDDA